jgi:hypothetical protein
MMAYIDSMRAGVPPARNRARRALLGMAVVVATAACAPPGSGGPAGLAAPPAPATVAIDSAQLIRDLSVLAHDSMEGRLVGAPGGARARAFLLRRYAEIGLQPVGTTFEQPFDVTRRDQQLRGVNVIGQVRGTALPDRYIVVTAHYDHLGVRNGDIYRGADDNASGTAALLQLARHFVQDRPRHSMLFIAFDAEEGGLSGARHFVANPTVPRESIVLNINMDMVSRSDVNELYVAGTHHYPHLLPLVQRAAAGAEVKLIPGHDRPVPTAQDDWTMQSDHGAFHAVGIPFLYFGVEDHPDYHRPTDTFENVTKGFYVRAVRSILATTRLIDAELNR